MRYPRRLFHWWGYGGSHSVLVAVAFASCRRAAFAVRLGLVAFLAPDFASDTACPY
jgi:hypothetical protein